MSYSASSRRRSSLPEVADLGFFNRFTSCSTQNIQKLGENPRVAARACRARSIDPVCPYPPRGLRDERAIVSTALARIGTGLQAVLVVAVRMTGAQVAWVVVPTIAVGVFDRVGWRVRV